MTHQGLYDTLYEHDACGVGFIVDMKGRRSHAIVQQARGKNTEAEAALKKAIELSPTWPGGHMAPRPVNK